MQLSERRLVVPAGRRRLKARCYDALMLVPLAVLTLLLALFLRYISVWWGPRPGFFDFSDLRELAYLFCMVGIFVPMLPVAVLVNEVISARKRGQTLGKKKAQICVLGLRDNRILRGSSIALPTVSRLMARAAVLYAPPAVLVFVWSRLSLFDDSLVPFVVFGAMLTYVLALAVPALVTVQGRGLHDLVAGTMVVDATALPAGYERSAIGRGPGG